MPSTKSHTESPKLSQGRVDCGVEWLLSRDNKLKHILPREFSLKFAKRPLSFETFIHVVVNQSLADKAADTICGRLFALFHQPVSPSKFLEKETMELRKCGISRAKINYLRSIANYIETNQRFFEKLLRLDLDESKKELLALKGIGPWSASIISLFYIGNPDVLVEGDVTINKVLARLYDVEIGDVSARIHELTEHWRPYRSIGCMVCWHLYDNDMI
jgi:DNA-3-methyladenine glycosylase II